MIIVNITRLDSPIQARLAEALVVGAAYYTTRAETLELRTEVPIGPYRADFTITVTDRRGVIARLVVEADGKDFHDPIKDAERDIWLRSQGWAVRRFTGSEIHRHATDCAASVMRDVDGIRELANIATQREAGRGERERAKVRVNELVQARYAVWEAIETAPAEQREALNTEDARLTALIDAEFSS